MKRPSLPSFKRSKSSDSPGPSKAQRKQRLGVDYETAWARRAPARLVRASMIETITRPLISLLASPTIVGTDRLEDIDGPVIFAANHTSHLDTSLLLSSLPARFRHRSVVAAGADYFFDKKSKARLWSLWVNAIPIERERVGRRSAGLAAELLSEKWNLIIFPEGTRSRDGYMNPFRGGAAYLGIRCNVPVVPIHLGGVREILGVNERRMRPGRTTVSFGEPLFAGENEKARDYNKRIEAAVAAAADEGLGDWYGARRREEAQRTPSLSAPEGVTGWRRSWLGNVPAAHRPGTRWPL